MTVSIVFILILGRIGYLFRSVSGKRDADKLYKELFFMYILFAITVNAGYALRIHGRAVNYNTFFSLLLLLFSVRYLFSGKFNRKVLRAGILFWICIFAGIVFAVLLPYHGGVVPNIADWDSVINGQSSISYDIKINRRIFSFLLGAVRFPIILSVASALISVEDVKTWIHRLYRVCPYLVGFGIIEFFTKFVIHVDIYPTVSCLIGETPAFSRLQGFTKEGSQYALVMFYYAAVIIIQSKFDHQKRNTSTENKELDIREVHWKMLAGVYLLMLLNTSLTSYYLLLVSIILLLLSVDARTRKIGLFFLSALVLVFILLGVRGVFAERFQRIHDVVASLGKGVLYHSGATSEGARLSSIYFAVKAALARPLFGVGLGNTDAHSAFFALLANFGFVGTWCYFAVWRKFARDCTPAARKTFLVFLASMLLSGGIGYFMDLSLPFLLLAYYQSDKRTIMKKCYIIDGLNIGFAKNITGIQRVCHELINRLDQHFEDFNLYYLYNPDDLNLVIDPTRFKYIMPIPVTKDRLPFWSDRIVKRKMRELQGTLLCFSLETVLADRQISFIYDLRTVTTKFDTPKIRAKFKFKMMLLKLSGYRVLLTDSNYQKSEIIRYFHIKDNSRVQVLYNGYEHVYSIIPDNRIFEKFPNIKKGKYYYSLGSLAPHKNIVWIKEVARRNPDKLFVIAGGKDPAMWEDNIQSDQFTNVIFTGYVTDEENRALMENCIAFIHPAKYEGFGIPPLEALAYGARIFISNATCLPEIYEDAAVYFDPDNYDVDLDQMEKTRVGDPQKILDKCSWDKSAEFLVNILETMK